MKSLVESLGAAAAAAAACRGGSSKRRGGQQVGPPPTHTRTYHRLPPLLDTRTHRSTHP